MANETTSDVDTSTSEGSPSDAFEAAASEVLDAHSASEADTPNEAPNQPTERSAKEEASLNWDTLDPRAKQEYETISKRYKDIQSYVTRKENEWKLERDKYKGYEDAGQKLKYLDNLYETNPKVKAILDEALGIKPQVDPDLAQDPLMQYFQTWEQKLQGSLRPVFDFVETQKRAQQEAELNSRVDKVTESARTQYKNLFGKDPTDQDMAKIYQHMTEKRVYDGETAVRSVYMEEAIRAKVQAALEEQMGKKSKASNLSTVNPTKSKPNGKIESWDDAFESAMEELGLTF